MKKSPFISILTASFNNESTLMRTLESIKYQSFQNLEHIVIDGGSQDNTLDILKKFENTYNLTWISESDHGIADALNKGIKRATGRYIIVIQADDSLLDNSILGKVYSILKNEEFDIYTFPVVCESQVQSKKLAKPIRLLWWHRFRNIFPHQGVFVHRRVFDRIGAFNDQYSISMDYDFFYRTLSSRCTIKFGKMPISLIGRAGISSSRAHLPRRLKEEFRIQNLNEKNLFWRLAQSIFRTFYFPYKLRFLPKLRRNIVK